MVESLTVFGSREKASASLPLVTGSFTTQPETPTFAIRVHHLSEAVSVGCARLAVVATRTRAKFHGEPITSPPIDRPLADFLDAPSDPLLWGGGPSE
jgi:hypothetical protein